MNGSVSAGRRVALPGIETPRLWTPPLRELTPETSHGFEVIDFARDILDIELYPWQRWLLIHALELNDDGTYRFRRIVVLVARQNGKSLLLTVLALWWLFVDSESFPEHVPPEEFLVLGTAQNLDLAEEAWERASGLCDPDDLGSERLAIPDLQAETLRPSRTNGKKAIRLRNGSRYEVRTATRRGGRGKSTSRVIMDELREQQNWDGWASISKTANATFNSQLWGVSNAGDNRSVVLAQLRTSMLETLGQWDAQVETGAMPVEAFAATHDMTSGLFEWSAPDGCDLDDPDAIRQANPSLGFGHMRWETVWSDLGNDPEGVFRTEVLCQFVTAAVNVYIEPREWALCLDRTAAPGDGLMLGIDTSADRQHSYIGVAGEVEEGVVAVELVASRAGMLWLPQAVAELAEDHGISRVALQARGCPAAEFIPALQDLGLEVIEIYGLHLGASAGRFKDRVRDRTIRHQGQPALDLAISGAVARKLGEQRVWDRSSSVVDIAPLVAVANAAYAIEVLRPEEFVSAYTDHGLMVL